MDALKIQKQLGLDILAFMGDAIPSDIQLSYMMAFLSGISDGPEHTLAEIIADPRNRDLLVRWRANIAFRLLEHNSMSQFGVIEVTMKWMSDLASNDTGKKNTNGMGVN